MGNISLCVYYDEFGIVLQIKPTYQIQLSTKQRQLNFYEWIFAYGKNKELIYVVKYKHWNFSFRQEKRDVQVKCWIFEIPFS